MSRAAHNAFKPLPGGLLEAIEAIANRTLALDTFAIEAIARLDGKVIALELPENGMRVYLSLHAQGIKVSATHDGAADVTIRGSIPSLIRYLLAARSGGVAGDFEINGDVGLARSLQDIFARLDLDWEEAASQRIGDTATRKLGVFLRATRDAAREARSALGMDVSEYLRFEKQFVPERGEVDRFMSSIDVLRDDVARLKFRLDRISRRGST